MYILSGGVQKTTTKLLESSLGIRWQLETINWYRPTSRSNLLLRVNQRLSSFTILGCRPGFLRISSVTYRGGIIPTFSQHLNFRWKEVNISIERLNSDPKSSNSPRLEARTPLFHLKILHKFQTLWICPSCQLENVGAWDSIRLLQSLYLIPASIRLQISFLQAVYLTKYPHISLQPRQREQCNRMFGTTKNGMLNYGSFSCRKTVLRPPVRSRRLI